MIFDLLENIQTYKGISKHLDTAISFLQNNDLYDLDDYTEVDGKNVFAMKQSYLTKPFDEQKWEAHRNYIDIQLMLGGSESFGVCNIDDVQPAVAYNDEKDVEFFIGSESHIPLDVDRFLILFPQDAHMPGRLIDEPEQVTKLVVKVKVQE